MSIRSRKIELAVSIPPAPRPIMVCVPDCSDVNEIAFNVPLTHKGSSAVAISFGATVNSLLHEAINLIAQFFSAACFISVTIYFSNTSSFNIRHVTFIPIIQFAKITSLAAASRPSKSRDSSAST